MSDELSPGRIGALPAIVTGVVALVTGACARILALAGRASLDGDDSFAVVAAGLSLMALVAALPSRPRYHRNVFVLPWLGAAVVALAMALLTVVEPEVRVSLAPSALEAAGGVAVVFGLTRWREVSILRDHEWPQVSGQAKSELHHDDSTSALVPASGIVASDEIRVHAGDRIPVDGYLSTDSARIDGSGVMGPSPIAVRQASHPVFASDRTEDAARVTVAGRWEESWAAQRNVRHDRLQAAQLIPDNASRTAASAVVLLGVAVAGFSMAQRGPFALASWLPSVAGALLGAVAVGPGLGRFRGRIAFLSELHRAGLVVSRMRDLRALMNVRNWFVDPALLSAPGAVEVIPFGDVSRDDLLGIGVALTQEVQGAHHASLLAATAGLEPPEGAALRYDSDVYQGTVNGYRWFLGSAAGVREVFRLEVDPASRGSMGFFQDRGQQLMVIGREDVGILGMIALDVEVSDGVEVAVEALKGRALPGGQEAEAVAERLGVPIARNEAGPKDATLLSEYTPPPQAGLRVRVVTPRPARKLPETGSPRLMRPALASVGRTIPYLGRYRRRTVAAAWLATITALGVSAGLALTVGLPPIGGALMGVFVVWTASGRRPSFKLR